MAVAIGSVLAVVSLVILLLPFLRRLTTTAAAGDPIQELRREREALYEETRILRQDFDLGHFSDEEYRTRFQANRLLAATLLRRQDELEAMSREFEEDILALRTLTAAEDESRRCFECGREVSSAAEQCGNCGAQAPGGGLGSHAEGAQ